MDHQEQTQQTEKNIIEMLEFLETSSEEENDLDRQTSGKDLDDNFLNKTIKNNLKHTVHTKKKRKSISTIVKKLEKLQQQCLANRKEISPVNNNHKHTTNTLNCETNSISNSQSEAFADLDDLDDVDWQFVLEEHCRSLFNISYTEEINKAIYKTTSGHPLYGSSEYYQAAQNYAIFGKHFSDFPTSTQMAVNNKNPLSESSNLIANFYNRLYTNPNKPMPNFSVSPPASLTTAASTAASTAAYYQMAQTCPAHSTNPFNTPTYGIFFGNNVTYMTGRPATPSLMYNQHNNTTTNFISNSLANAALATSPAILYTNPMLTTATQQYLTQFFGTTALTANSVQSATLATNAGGTCVNERLIYSQMLQQQLYQRQQAAAVAAMLQQNQRFAAAAAHNTHNITSVHNNRSSPQHVNAFPATSSTSRSISNTLSSQAQSISPSERLVEVKSPTSTAIAKTKTKKKRKSTGSTP